MKLKNILKEQKGILVSDAIVAIMVLLLFAGIISTIAINIVFESTKIKMDSQQIDYAIEVLEYAEKIPYEDVTTNNLINYINSKDSTYVSACSMEESINNLTTPYKISISVQKYNNTPGNTDKLDLIKIVKVSVTSSLRNKEYSTEIKTIKKVSEQEIKRITINK